MIPRKGSRIEGYVSVYLVIFGRDGARTEPLEDVRHELLAASVFDPGDVLCHLEVSLWAVPPFLVGARVVNAELGDLTKRAALLPVVDDEAASSPLGALGRFLDRVDQIRTAGADVGTEDIGAVALVVRAESDLARKGE